MVKGRVCAHALYVHTNRLIIESVHVSPCVCCLQIVATWYSALIQNLTMATFQGNTLVLLHSFPIFLRTLIMSPSTAAISICSSIWNHGMYLPVA